jgi:multiple sugar transport system permease protein
MRPTSRAQFAKHLLAAGACCLILAPFLWMISTSLKNPAEVVLRDPTIIPRSFAVENYVDVFRRGNFGRYFLNSVIVSLAVTVISVAIATLSGYAFARYRLPGGKAILLGILATQMFPAILLAIPLYILIRNLGLLNSLLGLILVYTSFALPFCVWMLRNYFLTIPKDLDESALVDGATRLQAMTRIVLPLAIPGVLSAGIFSFTLGWNEFLYALVLMGSGDMKTAPVGVVSDFIRADQFFWGLLMAAGILTSVPVAIAYAFLVDHYVSGLTAGATKG